MVSKRTWSRWKSNGEFSLVDELIEDMDDNGIDLDDEDLTEDEKDANGAMILLSDEYTSPEKFALLRSKSVSLFINIYLKYNLY